MNNDLNEALSKLSFKKAQYIKWKFNIWMDANRVVTEEEFLKSVNLKTLSSFNRWERTNEYLHIVTLILQSKQASDLLDIYDKVKKSIEGDNPDKRDIELMLKLMKEINALSKDANRFFHGGKVSNNYEDEIEL